MAEKSRQRAKRVATVEKRGGYTSSSKPASALKPPPSGPGPGAAKPAGSNRGAKKS